MNMKTATMKIRKTALGIVTLATSEHHTIVRVNGAYRIYLTDDYRNDRAGARDVQAFAKDFEEAASMVREVEA